MLLEEARELALQLMKKHGLEFWHFKYDGAKRRFGCCLYRTKHISLSKHLVLLNNKEKVENIILHEIAHAMVGSRNGHNWHWRQTAIEIGCDGKRCYSSKDTEIVEKNIVAICPKCGKKSARYRMTKKEYSCGKCSGNEFNSEYLLVFKRLSQP
jgi:predicted SprT family Zn-dependent metalloprotease